MPRPLRCLESESAFFGPTVVAYLPGFKIHANSNSRQPDAIPGLSATKSTWIA